MVSVLGDYLYEFPQTMPLEHLLADCLEQEVDEKYYLSDATIDTYLEYNKRNEEKGNGFKFEPTPTTGGDSSIAKAILTRAGSRPCDNYVGQLSPNKDEE